MRITRRQFLKYISAAAATMGLTQAELQNAIEALATNTPLQGARVAWLSGQACTGCTMSFVNLYSKPGDPVVDGYDVGTLSGVLPGMGYDGVDTIADAALTVIDLDAHETIQASAGDLAMDWLRPWSSGTQGAGGSLDVAVLVVEGGIPMDGVDPWGNATVGEDACTIGTIPTGFAGAGTEVTMRDAVVNIAQKATTLAVIAVGQCATYGGIPAAHSDTSEQWSGAAKGVQAAASGAGGVPGGLSIFGTGGTNPKVINVPGCPPHPDWIYGTIARLILTLGGTPGLLTLDSVGRPTAYFGDSIHGGSCPRYSDYNKGYLASRLGDKGCLAAIGCYGMSTHADCAKRGWNSSRLTLGKKVFCIEAGHPCISCSEPGYPFKINTNG